MKHDAFTFIIISLSFLLIKTDNNTHCPKKTACKWTYPYFVTENLKCTQNAHCPMGLLCCADCNYLHKVCKNPELDSACPEDKNLCTQPFALALTKNFECASDADCNRLQICCADGCYAHKICKNKFNYDVVCPSSVRRDLCPNANRTYPRYSCGIGEECLSGYVCCTDNCYEHRICKLPKDAFSYNKIYEAYVVLEKREGGPRCPPIEARCLRTHSLRLAKSAMCFRDEDCDEGRLCCKDACVKNFKICKKS